MPRDTAPGFFDDLSIIPPKPLRQRIHRVPGGGPRPRSSGVDNPCDGCPLNDGRPKIPPTRATGQARIHVVGLGPSKQEEIEGKHFVGRGGDLLRRALKEAGLDPEAEVDYLNMTRCRPDDDNFDGKQWESAAKKCRRWLSRDLSLAVPVLALGTKPLHALSGDSKARITGYHGLWVASQQGYRLFATRHPAGILRLKDEEREEGIALFLAEIRTMVDGLKEAQAVETVPIFRTPNEARETLQWLAKFPHPWSFDIESFDAKEFPSRKDVSTDPCHPDFRMHGIAVAVSSTKGFYLYLKDYHENKKVWTPLLAPAFLSSAEKWAFSGHFDEEAVVYPGWVPRVINRRGDGMLALVTLGDGRHESLRLERATVDILGRPQYWSGLDKSRMRDHPIEAVAAGAVADAITTYALCLKLHHRIKAGLYL